jgi:hypothetical protein
MVHRTDIAGGSSGQASPGSDRVCRPALSRALFGKHSFDQISAHFSPRRREVLPSHDGVPPVPAIYLEPLTL